MSKKIQQNLIPLIIRINDACMRKQMYILNFPYSNVNIQFLKTLIQLGFIIGYLIHNSITVDYYPVSLWTTKTFINIHLKIKKNISIIKKITLFSTGTRGLYYTISQLKNLQKNNINTKYILHTSQYGIISNETAIKMRIGGELICSITC